MARTGPRTCAHCRKELLDYEERRPDREYCDSSCRARASEARKRAAAGRPAKKRAGNAQKRSRAAQARRKPSLRISYLKAVEVMALAIQKRSAVSHELAVELARAELATLLTDRQRASLSTTVTAGRGATTDRPAGAAA